MNPHSFTVSRVALFAASLLVAMPASADDYMALPLGVPRVIDAGAPITRIVVAAQDLLQVSVADDHDLQITGLKPGRTSLTVFTSGSGEGHSYQITIAGGAARHRRGAPAAAPGIAAQIHQNPDLAGVTVADNGKTVVLAGSVPNLDSHTEAMAIAAGTGKTVVDQTAVTGNQMVAVDIRFAVVSTSTLNELGFNFQELGSGLELATTGPSTVSSFSGVGAATPLPIASAFNLFVASSKSNILSTLSALQQSGLTQLLAEPTLLVRSGNSASFLAGGEVPIPVPQSGDSNGTITIEYHKYGVKLDIAPVVLSSDRIALRVAPEVSEIDSANGLTLDSYTVPAFLTRSTDTTIELGDGQSFVIAGLMYSNNSFTESKFPFLGDLPIVGEFFRVTQNARERQELIVVATPHLVRPLREDQIPALPGENISSYNPTIGQQLVDTNSVDDEITAYGLMN